MEKILEAETVMGTSKKGLFEYWLIASPSKEVYEKIMGERLEFYRNYQQAAVTNTRPHITISNFLAHDEMEDTMIRWLQRIVGDQRSFEVMLNNYSGLPPDTIFLRVQDPAPFKELATQLRPIDFYIKSNACPPVHFAAHPHLSIAGRLPPAIYEQAIREYACKTFHESFAVTELILLRRQYQHEACRQVAVFKFQPQDNYIRN
jgi:hypothetical protein